MSVELTNEQAKTLVSCVELWKLQVGLKRLDPIYAELIKLLTPKLAEPKNFGAIVKDEDGQFFTLCDTSEVVRWRGKKTGWASWSRIPNPTLIFEGVKE